MPRPDISTDKAAYQTALEQAHREYPPWTGLSHTPDTCPCHDFSFVIFCDGGNWDIVRCRKCGAERLARCTFDDDYS